MEDSNTTLQDSRPKRMARKAGSRTLYVGSSRISIGSPQYQPASRNFGVRIPHPEKISQKQRQPRRRIEAISEVHAAGHAGRSTWKLSLLNVPLRVSSTRVTSSGLDPGETTRLSVPESSSSRLLSRWGRERRGQQVGTNSGPPLW